MSQIDKRLFLLDAYALIFRGYYAFIKNPRVNSKGFNTSAIMGFTNSLFDIIRREKPTHLAVVFDVGQATVRTTYYSDYKANRDETPEAIRLGVPYIQDILKALKIPILFAEGYEADDVIGTLAKKAENDGFTTYMVTPDKDFAQLVTDNIKIYRPAANGKGVEIWGIEEVKEKFDIDFPSQVIDYLGMMGDTVDNIPGLPGVGAKTASKYIKEFGSLEALLENTDKLKGKAKEKIEQNKDLGILSKKLATILTDAPVEFDETDLTVCSPDIEKVTELFTELEFRRLLDTVYNIYGLVSPNSEEDIQTKISKGSENSTMQNSQQSLEFNFFTNKEDVADVNPHDNVFQDISTTDHYYQLIDTIKGRELLLKNILKQKEVTFDTETTSLDALSAELVGISFSWEKGKGYYISFPSNFDETKKIINEFRPFFESEEVTKIGQNLKYDIKVLAKYDIILKGKNFDTMIAHYLINPDMRHNMDVLSETYLNYQPISIEGLIGKKGKNQKNFRDVPLQDQTEYGVEDSDITHQLKSVFEPSLIDTNTYKLFSDLEMPLVQVLADMELEGVNLDVTFLKNLSVKHEENLKKLEVKIYQDAGDEFNLNSPKQLGEILFDKLELDPKAKKTKTGQYATGEEVLSKLKDKHIIVRDILEYRQLQKLKSTYIDALPNLVNPKTNRLHTTYTQTVAATGRLSSINPNLQNIPIRSEAGQEIRKAFIARDENHVLISADYSQIELRLIAQMSQDPIMIKAFESNEDIHAITASKVFNVPLDQITREQRSQAKTVNFGIIYGVSAFSLADQAKIARKDAKILIDAYYETYPALKTYIEKQVNLARDKGYVETLLGRRRYLKDINSKNAVVRSHAERNAVNAPIQGTAADIIKLAMVQLQEKLKGYDSKMILQVHDELVFDTPKHEVEKVSKIIKETMENAMKLDIPLTAEIGYGQNWLEAH